MSDSRQFTFKNADFQTIRRNPIGGPVGRPQNGAVITVDVGCACGYSWTAQGSDLGGFQGGIFVTCPACNASEPVSHSALLNGA